MVEQRLVDDHGQVVAEGGDPADAVAGGRADLVGARLADLGHVEASASMSSSTRWSPAAMHTTGSPSATKTRDFAIWACPQPTATAASWAVAVDASR